MPSGAAADDAGMRAVCAAWGRARWPGCRVMHELVLGNRRIDLLFVGERDLRGLEIKSGADTLSRLEGQMREYGRYVPEVWLAIAPRWQDDDRVHYWGRNMIVVPSTGAVVEYRKGQRPHRDELVCSRLLEVLWYAEACAIAVRTGVIPMRVHKQMRRGHVLKMLARLLTGNEILAEVCRELRARGSVGAGSDAPMSTEAPPPEANSRPVVLLPLDKKTVTGSSA